MAKTTFSIVLRVVVAMSTLVAAIVMVITKGKTNNQITSCVDDNFHSWNGYFVAVEFIACGLNILPIGLPSGSKLWSLIFLLDTIVVILQFISWTSIMVCYQYMKSGNPYGCCKRECNLVHGICSMVLGALVAAGIATFTSFLFLCYSVQKITNFLSKEEIPIDNVIQK